MELQEQIQRRKNKLKYYRKARERGDKMFYALDPGERCCNTEEERGKRRYGFSRTTVHQRRRLSKSLINHRKNKKKIRCYTFNSYVSTKKINEYYSKKDFTGLMEYMYINYKNPIALLDDYNSGFRDPIILRILSITGVLKYSNAKQVFLDNFQDILVDALLAFHDELDNYVEESGVSFYVYLKNILPYRFASSFSSYKESNVDIKIDNPINKTYEIDFGVNPLGAYILNNLKEMQK